MSLLVSNEILNSVKKELNNAVSSVQIITAYCKTTSFNLLNSYISNEVTARRLLVRFRLEDILKGSTDFDLIEDAYKLGWKVYIRFDLHAKTYVVDNKRGLVGSANATSSGLGIRNPGNMEMATLVDIEEKDIEKIDKLFRDAILVDDELIQQMKNQLISIDTLHGAEGYIWNPQITSLFNPKVETLFSYELPDKNEYKYNEFIPFLDIIFENDEKMKESLRWSNAYLWLLNVLKDHNGCMYFGELSSELHNAVVSDPKPYRKEVKMLLANLLELIQSLEMNEIIIDRPNYSQRIQLISR